MSPDGRIARLKRHVCGFGVCTSPLHPSGAGGTSPLQPSGVLPRATVDEQRELLAPLLPTKADVVDWVTQTPGVRAQRFPFGQFDAELGYLHRDRDFVEGIDGSVCTYTYDALGARKTIAHADLPCRINTYGNSFTSCEQVSDGETWQEFLASYLGEPVRNYGIGGYSVYQAYRRMLREEARAPSDVIIFNIFGALRLQQLFSQRLFALISSCSLPLRVTLCCR